MARPSKYAPELRDRAVRMVFDHTHEYPSQWATIRSVAEKLGCTSEVLRRWVCQAERDAGKRPGLTTDERQRLIRKRTNAEISLREVWLARCEEFLTTRRIIALVFRLFHPGSKHRAGGFQKQLLGCRPDWLREQSHGIRRR